MQWSLNSSVNALPSTLPEDFLRYNLWNSTTVFVFKSKLCRPIYVSCMHTSICLLWQNSRRVTFPNIFYMNEMSLRGFTELGINDTLYSIQVHDSKLLSMDRVLGGSVQGWKSHLFFSLRQFLKPGTLGRALLPPKDTNLAYPSRNEDWGHSIHVIITYTRRGNHCRAASASLVPAIITWKR